MFLCFSPTSKELFSGEGHSICVWKEQTPNQWILIQNIQTLTPLTHIGVSPNGKILVAAGNPSMICEKINDEWEWTNSIVSNNSYRDQSIHWSPNGNLLAIEDNWGFSIYSDKKLPKCWTNFSKRIKCLARWNWTQIRFSSTWLCWTPEEFVITTVGRDGTIVISKLSGDNMLLEINRKTLQKSPIRAATFFQAGNIFATFDYNHLVNLYSYPQLEHLQTLNIPRKHYYYDQNDIDPVIVMLKIESFRLGIWSHMNELLANKFIIQSPEKSRLEEKHMCLSSDGKHFAIQQRKKLEIYTNFKFGPQESE